MTDKDIKDYCKYCSIEPPAMEFECPECKHNPDNENNLAKDINVSHKEQIIIDELRQEWEKLENEIKKLRKKLRKFV